MELIGIIASIMAAVVSTISLVFTVRNSKRFLLRSIDKKEQRIRQIDDQNYRKHGLYYRRINITPLDEERDRLNDEIEIMRRLL